MPSDSDSHKPCVLCGQTGKAQQALSIIRLSCCKGKCRDYDYIKATDPVSCCTTIMLPDLRAPLNSAQHGAFLSDHVCSSHASDCSRGPGKREQQGRTPSISLLLHMSRKDIWWVLIIQICYLKLFLHVKVVIQNWFCMWKYTLSSPAWVDLTNKPISQAYTMGKATISLPISKLCKNSIKFTFRSLTNNSPSLCNTYLCTGRLLWDTFCDRTFSTLGSRLPSPQDFWLVFMS